MTPMYSSGSKFIKDAYKNKAVVLRIDGSAKRYEIDKNSHAVIGGGRTLFDGGKGTVWGEKGLDQSNLCPPQYLKKYVKTE